MKKAEHGFWIAIASNPLFTPDDRCKFHVGMCRTHDDVEEATFVEFHAGADARSAMHDLVDRICDRADNLRKLEEFEQQQVEKERKKAEEIAEKKRKYEDAPKIADHDISSLTIGESGNLARPEESKKQDSDQGLLDLNDLL